MGGSNVPKTQKSSPSSIECQGYDDSFFDAVYHEYLPQGSIVNQIYYIERLKRGQNCGEVTTGFIITTTLHPTQHSELVSFWSNTRSLFFPTPSAHLTLLLVTFYCSHTLTNPQRNKI